ncbi:MAG: formyltransferase family protein [Saprospiraceae bacterium]
MRCPSPIQYEKEIQLAIFASGTGSNARKIMEYFQDHPEIAVGLVVSNRKKQVFLKLLNRSAFLPTSYSGSHFTNNAKSWIRCQNMVLTTLPWPVFWLIPAYLIEEFPDKMVNIHPALLPKYGGKGMYGHHVHEAVKAAGETESGITIHLVNAKYDEGRTLFQASCPINPEDDPDTIAANVLALEHANYPRVIEEWMLAD